MPVLAAILSGPSHKDGCRLRGGIYGGSNRPKGFRPSLIAERGLIDPPADFRRAPAKTAITPRGLQRGRSVCWWSHAEGAAYARSRGVIHRLLRRAGLAVVVGVTTWAGVPMPVKEVLVPIDALSRSK